MAILTNSGRTAIAMAIAAQPIHYAWGVGLPSWATNRPAESLAAESLVAEVGRRIATDVQYVWPSDDGDIVVPLFNDADGNSVPRRFMLSQTPTQHLYMRFNFDYSDAPASTIREVAIFVGTTIKSSVPVGQKYFVPADISSPGTMLALENLSEVIVRSPNSRQSFEFVLTI
ncbi:MAG: hypothetical protein ACMV0I_05180 [Pseudomonas sp.]